MAGKAASQLSFRRNMKIYRIADVKEITDDMKNMEEMKAELTPQEIDEFQKQLEEQMKMMTPEDKKEAGLMLKEHDENTSVPGTDNNTTMDTVKNLQQKPQDRHESSPSSLSREQRSVFSPIEMLLKSKMPEIKEEVRDPKGKVVMNELFETMTDGNKAEMNKSIQRELKPVLNKYKQRMDDAGKKKNENL